MRTLVLFLVPLLAACASLDSPTPSDSGIQGQVLVGPMCPVVQEGEDCPDQPYQAILTVRALSGGESLRFETDEEGRFRIPLAPGEYLLVPEPPEDAPFPFAGEQLVLVQPGQFTRIMVLYDSGIR